MFVISRIVMLINDGLLYTVHIIIFTPYFFHLPLSLCLSLSLSLSLSVCLSHSLSLFLSLSISLSLSSALLCPTNVTTQTVLVSTS